MVRKLQDFGLVELNRLPTITKIILTKDGETVAQSLLEIKLVLDRQGGSLVGELDGKTSVW